MTAHFAPRPHARGRRRSLDRNNKRLVLDAVSRGATMAEAAVAVGVSLRTIQREARFDPDFDQELRRSHSVNPDPLVLMQSAARTHWRAAAWLLERTDPERYAKRPASAISPRQFEAALSYVLEAALEATALDERAAMYEHVQAACNEAVRCVLPNLGPWDQPINPQLPLTPLADLQRRERLKNPKHRRVVSENELGRIEAVVPPARLPAAAAQPPRVCVLLPIASHGDNQALDETFHEVRRDIVSPTASSQRLSAPQSVIGSTRPESRIDSSVKSARRDVIPTDATLKLVVADSQESSIAYNLPPIDYRHALHFLSPKTCIATQCGAEACAVDRGTHRSPRSSAGNSPAASSDATSELPAMQSNETERAKI